MSVEIKKNQNLAKFSYFGIGGNADEIWKISDIKSMAEAWRETIAEKIPRIILGKGSNLVFADKGLRGRVFIFTGKEYVRQKNIVTVEAGEILQKMVENFAGFGFRDLENLSGIPGTLGGAVRGNAGAYGSEISDKIMEVEYLDEDGNLKKIPRNLCEFSYRTSIFKKNPNWFITRATFLLAEKDEPEICSKKVKEHLMDRIKKNPSGRSGGSFFKNPENSAKNLENYKKNSGEKVEKLFAGKLLDEAGAKGDKIGAVQISEKHANFFMNTGGAKQADLLKLAKKWQDQVWQKFQIKLEPEVVLLDEYGKLIKLD